jgi:hypothetical protein
MRRLRAKVLLQIKENKIDIKDCCYGIDDTIVGKYGAKIFRIGSWGRHGGGMIRGQRIMTLALVIKSKGIAIPLAFDFCPKKEDEKYRSSLKIAVELIDNIFLQDFPNLPVVFDSWFDSVELMKDLSKRKVNFVIESKSNRKMKTNPSSYAKWKDWKSLFKKKLRRSVKINKTANSKRPRKIKYIAEDYVFLRKHSTRLKAMAVYNKPYGQNYFAIYLTNNLDMCSSEVWELSRARWHIEELFRNLKQELAFAKLPTTNENAAYACVCIPFSIYIKIIFSDGDGAHSIETTFGSIIKGIREEAFEKSINKLMDKKNSIK